MKLGSYEYLEEAQIHSNGNEEYRELAKGQYEAYTFVIEAEPEKGVKEDIVLGFDIQDGEITEIWMGSRPTLFTLSAPYSTWVDILRGKMGATKAITMRKLNVQGPFLQLLKGANRVLRWVEILQTIPTEFEGDYEQYNITGIDQ